MEIVKGLHKARADKKLAQFLAELPSAKVIPVSTDVGTLAGRICAELERAATPIGRADPLIAATAIHHRLDLDGSLTAGGAALAGSGGRSLLASALGWRKPFGCTGLSL